MHRSLLCLCSAYFHAALAGGTTLESLTLRFDLVVEDPVIVRLFVQWIYSGFPYFEYLCYVKNSEDALRPIFEYGRTNLSQKDLVDLWLFAERFGVKALQNDVIDALLPSFYQTETDGKESDQMFLEKGIIKYVYSKTRDCRQHWNLRNAFCSMILLSNARNKEVQRIVKAKRARWRVEFFNDLVEKTQVYRGLCDGNEWPQFQHWLDNCMNTRFGACVFHEREVCALENMSIG